MKVLLKYYTGDLKDCERAPFLLRKEQSNVFIPEHYTPEFRYHGAWPIHVAVFRGHEEVVKMLLEAKSDVDGPMRCQVMEVVPIDRRSPTLGWMNYSTMVTPLHVAAELGHVGIVRALLLHRADIEALVYEPLCRTPPEISTEPAGWLERTALVLSEGLVGWKWRCGTNMPTHKFASMVKATHNQWKGRHGVTALSKALEHGHADVVEELLKFRCNVHGCLDVHHYAGVGQAPVEVLCRNLSMMHIAALRGDSKSVQLLLKAKADPSPVLARTEEGPLSERRGDGIHPDRSPLLEIEWRHMEGVTPLHEAAKYGHAEVCQLLVAAGASVRDTFSYRRRLESQWTSPTQEARYQARELARFFKHKRAYQVLVGHDVAWTVFICAELVRRGRASALEKDKVTLLERLPGHLARGICRDVSWAALPPPDSLPKGTTHQTGIYWSSSYLGLMAVAAAGNKRLQQNRRVPWPEVSRMRTFDAAT